MNNSMSLALVAAMLCIAPTSCFQFPKIKFVGAPGDDMNAPSRRIQRGEEEADKLRASVESHLGIRNERSVDSDFPSMTEVSFYWEPDSKEGYEIADLIFEQVANYFRVRLLDQKGGSRTDGNSLPTPPDDIVLAFPSMSRQSDLEKLAATLRTDKCKQLLGIEKASAELYPSCPAPYIRVKFSPIFEKSSHTETSQSFSETYSAFNATKSWIDNFLGKYRLCPYTSSISRAAVGLSSVGVPVGGVHIQVVESSIENVINIDSTAASILTAAELVSAFWAETVYLLRSPEEEWATSLVVSPVYDGDFESFADVCDSIVEPTVLATQSTDFIGRAWFHPKYDADLIGHSDVIAGHAVPHKMVKEFMESLSTLNEEKGYTNEIKRNLVYDELARANDKVRQTPHATINILRRSQLTAAGKYEKGLGDKKPKPNSIYVRNAVRLANALRIEK